MSEMYSITRYAMDGSVTGSDQMPKDFFGKRTRGSAGLVHQVALAMLAGQRHPLAHTKMRGEVRGGGKKPWKQKGTGRARVGSIRSPIWRGGGVVFGPRSNRVYEQKINTKMKQKAFLTVLKEHLEGNALSILEPAIPAENPKTKTMAKTVGVLRGALNVASKPILFLLSKTSDPSVKRVTRNIDKVTVLDIGELSVMNLLQYSCVLLTPNAFVQLADRCKKYKQS